MTTVYYICLEPLEERYTAQWYKHFPIKFREFGFDVVVVDGKALSNHVGVGTFLDINSTIAYKNSQMQKVAELFHTKQIKSGDIFFVADTEYWGLESLRLLSQMNEVDIKIYSFLHAASYTKEDAFEVAAPYQKYTELGWIAACDGVFVGTQYHKDAVIERRIKPYAHPSDIDELSDKLIVSGNPLFKEDYEGIVYTKKKQLIITNRFDWEKRPNLSLNFAYLLKKRNPDLNVIITTSRPKFKSNKQWLVDYARALESEGILTIYEGLSKKEYHQHLAESKVMLTNSIEENFGYCIAEAMVYNTHPLAPVGLSHDELLFGNPDNLFGDMDEIIEKAEALLEKDYDYSGYISMYYDTLNFICEKMKFG